MISSSMWKRLSQIKNEVYEIPKSLENVLRGYQKVGFQWFKFLTKSGLGGFLQMTWVLVKLYRY